MKICAKSDIGIVRKLNQDYFFTSKEEGLFIIADGMGGHKAGDIASRMAVTIVKDKILKNKMSGIENIKENIVKSIEYANKEVFLKSIEVDDYHGMGTTITMAYIYYDKLILGHVGDSRAYLISNNHIEQLTEDHSLVEELLKSGTITEVEAKNHPRKNIITRAVGTASSIKVDIEERYIKKGDILILCTDGLSNNIKSDEIKNMFLLNNISDASDKLIELAKLRKSCDNITLIAITF